MAQKPMLVLAILDGWGVGRQDTINPIPKAGLTTLPYLQQQYPSGSLQASGIAVGLPWGEVGNSEVGHLTIGAGTVLYQHFPRITLAIERGEFAHNEVFLNACDHAKKHNSAVNIAGLLTEGSIHASFAHLEALIKLAAEQGVTRVNLHLFADGKDSRPRSVRDLLKRLKGVINETGVGVLASLTGRHYALDRDNHFERTQRAYDAMTGRLAPETRTLDEVIDEFYTRDQSDEYMPAVVLGKGEHAVKSNDALIFIDFREDSIRQIAASFIEKDFDTFETEKLSNLYVATMTQYAKHFKVPVAFPPQEVTQPLGKVLSDAGLSQLLIAETEKYAHVTYFFNGYRDEVFSGQTKVLIPSRNVERHDKEPQMMASVIADKAVEALETHSADVIILNFANADMVAHTGNFAAAITAVKTVDEQLGRIVAACEKTGSYLVVTADHGNVEIMIDPMTGSPETSHDLSAVPVVIAGPELKRKTPQPINRSEESVGILSDVAPTILALLRLPQPPEMTGQNLLPFLR